MRFFIFVLLTSSCFLLSACNDDSDNKDIQSNSNPASSSSKCEIHCAP